MFQIVYVFNRTKGNEKQKRNEIAVRENMLHHIVHPAASLASADHRTSSPAQSRHVIIKNAKYTGESRRPNLQSINAD